LILGEKGRTPTPASGKLHGAMGEAAPCYPWIGCRTGAIAARVVLAILAGVYASHRSDSVRATGVGVLG
jgi:hypothetical protein